MYWPDDKFRRSDTPPPGMDSDHYLVGNSVYT